MNLRGLRKAADDFSLLLQALTDPEIRLDILNEISGKLDELESTSVRVADEVAKLEKERKSFLEWREQERDKAQNQVSGILEAAHANAESEVRRIIAEAKAEAGKRIADAEEISRKIQQEQSRHLVDLDVFAKERDLFRAEALEFERKKKEFLARLSG